MNQHQHTPEIEQQLKVWNKEMEAITFTTQLLPITRGIMATSYVKLKENYSTKQLVELYEHTYQQSPFVRVRPVGNYPSVKEVAGSNHCDIGLHVDERTGRMTIISVIDNLMKGAAGQAVQNANLMFGMEETTGLEDDPVIPIRRNDKQWKQLKTALLHIYKTALLQHQKVLRLMVFMQGLVKGKRILE